MAQSLIAISVLHWLILLTPGPNVLLVAGLAAAGQRRAALMAAAGITLVAGTWATLAVLGIHGIFASHTLLRLAVQLVGALYLLHIAVRLWGSKGMPGLPQTQGQSSWAAFRLGFITNIANPKSALFFGSVFATALPPQPGPVLMGLSVVAVLVNALAWHLLLALLFSRPRVQALYAARSRVVSRISGTAVGIFGLRLLADACSSARPP